MAVVVRLLRGSVYLVSEPQLNHQKYKINRNHPPQSDEFHFRFILVFCLALMALDYLFCILVVVLHRHRRLLLLLLLPFTHPRRAKQTVN